ncbi:5546_t:CDS:2, partial [Ambispora leptoticha]
MCLTFCTSGIRAGAAELAARNKIFSSIKGKSKEDAKEYYKENEEFTLLASEESEEVGFLASCLSILDENLEIVNSELDTVLYNIEDLLKLDLLIVKL